MKLPAWLEARGSGERRSANPYDASKRAWTDHTGRLVAERNVLIVVSLMSLCAAIASAGALSWIALGAKFVPYVVEVDRAGNVEAVQVADGYSVASRAMIEAQTRNFVRSSREVTPDRALQDRMVRSAFEMVAYGDPAVEKLRVHFEEADPYTRAETQTVAVEVQAVVPISDKAWQVDWSERVYARTGALQKAYAMRATLHVYQTEPKPQSEADIRPNPLGIFIEDFNWARLEDKGGAK